MRGGKQTFFQLSFAPWIVHIRDVRIPKIHSLILIERGGGGLRMCPTLINELFFRHWNENHWVWSERIACLSAAWFHKETMFCKVTKTSVLTNYISAWQLQHCTAQFNRISTKKVPGEMLFQAALIDTIRGVVIVPALCEQTWKHSKLFFMVPSPSTDA